MAKNVQSANYASRSYDSWPKRGGLSAGSLNALGREGMDFRHLFF
jgi:hypothetical protein